jgi:hypothetical protein
MDILFSEIFPSMFELAAIYQTFGGNGLEEIEG